MGGFSEELCSDKFHFSGLTSPLEKVLIAKDQAHDCLDPLARLVIVLELVS